MLIMPSGTRIVTLVLFPAVFPGKATQTTLK